MIMKKVKNFNQFVNENQQINLTENIKRLNQCWQKCMELSFDYDKSLMRQELNNLINILKSLNLNNEISIVSSLLQKNGSIYGYEKKLFQYLEKWW